MNQPAPASRGRILIADDDQQVCKATSDSLQRRGFVCTCVASGAEVVACLRIGEYDALISDLLMPGNDGLSLIETVPQLAAGLPIVLLTGAPTVETAAGSLRLPVVAYLTKPTDFSALATILDAAILKHRAFRSMQIGRRHLVNWEHEIDAVLEQYRTPGPQPDGPMSHYLRLTLRHVILVLAELEQATRAMENGYGENHSSRLLDREVALRRAVDVLRRTKQSFKSKELADLRKELEQLLARGDAEAEGEATGAAN
jgi:CheY-like chemotaxis protein